MFFNLNIDIDKWNISDVSAWLDSMMLSQYIPIFQSNAIYGSVILDLSLDDLDYMGITILGHRKILLKAIEDLRINKRVTINISSNKISETSNTYNNNNNNIPMVSKDDMSETKNTLSSAVISERKVISSLSYNNNNNMSSIPTHWSDIKPLSSNKVII